MLRGKLGRVRVEFLHDLQWIIAIGRANPIVAEDRYIDAGFVLLLEQTIKIENRFR